MREQLPDALGGLCGQAVHDVLEVGVRIVAVELGDRGSALILLELLGKQFLQRMV